MINTVGSCFLGLLFSASADASMSFLEVKSDVVLFSATSSKASPNPSFEDARYFNPEAVSTVVNPLISILHTDSTCKSTNCDSRLNEFRKILDEPEYREPCGTHACVINEE